MGLYPSSVLAAAVAAPGEVEIEEHDGNRLDDFMREVIPDTRVTRLVMERARFGLPTREPGTPNRVSFVEDEHGNLVAVFPEGE